MKELGSETHPRPCVVECLIACDFEEKFEALQVIRGVTYLLQEDVSDFYSEDLLQLILDIDGEIVFLVLLEIGEGGCAKEGGGES